VPSMEQQHSTTASNCPVAPSVELRFEPRTQISGFLQSNGSPLTARSVGVVAGPRSDNTPPHRGPRSRPRGSSATITTRASLSPHLQGAGLHLLVNHIVVKQRHRPRKGNFGLYVGTEHSEPNHTSRLQGLGTRTGVCRVAAWPFTYIHRKWLESLDLVDAEGSRMHYAATDPQRM
jgi:hypothetical protein